MLQISRARRKRRTRRLKVSAQETTAALQETTAELKNLKGELIVCAVVAVGATLLTLVTTLVLGNILREIAIETFETLRV